MRTSELLSLFTLLDYDADLLRKRPFGQNQTNSKTLTKTQDSQNILLTPNKQHLLAPNDLLKTYQKHTFY